MMLVQHRSALWSPSVWCGKNAMFMSVRKKIREHRSVLAVYKRDVLVVYTCDILQYHMKLQYIVFAPLQSVVVIPYGVLVVYTCDVLAWRIHVMFLWCIHVMFLRGVYM